MKWTACNTNQEVCDWVRDNPDKRLIFLIDEQTNFVLFYEETKPPAGELVGGAMTKEEIFEILEDCKEYFEDKADADHDGNGFVPNKEMKLSAEITLVIIQLKSSH